ncbi:YbbR-like domain-containing protein [Pedobacter sp. SD-b]|uniref:YbbR-like domain-containing protein n=1 Tax=Pedobacter segetis TaxID=2793069 RepID=A0ABS1BJC6_9SPHI|nr:CdaR family protein [Pedobacter segetis]MBK0382952.1 YbbR-like domain-containing protein [Pedobacter segetis]
MAIIKLSAIERRKLTIFFTCLILAVLAWLFFSLSNNYEYEVKTAVIFKNPPLNKAFNPLQSDTVVLTVQGTGWQLLFTKLRIYPKDVKVSLAPLKNRNFITFTNQLKDINQEYSSQQQIVSVVPDTLYFDFTTRKVKRVPIKLVTKLSFIKQFGQSNQVVLDPKEVTVTGPQKELDKITYWPTDTLDKNKVNVDIIQNVSLKQPDENNISVFPSQTLAKIPIEEFTEKTFKIPVKVINNKEYYNIKLIPEKVKIVFMVPLSAYANVNESDFVATVDFNLWKNDKMQQLPIVIEKKKPFLKFRRVEPNQIDFFIRK